eukprot:10777351-Alexandrium_andersonii.AAC.1
MEAARAHDNPGPAQLRAGQDVRQRADLRDGHDLGHAPELGRLFRGPGHVRSQHRQPGTGTQADRRAIHAAECARRNCPGELQAPRESRSSRISDVRSSSSSARTAARNAPNESFWGGI